jgi:serine/threonine protein kinase
MGNKSGKINYDEAMSMSSSGRGGVREGLSTWHREGVEVTDVYEIEGVLGSGLMGEVYKVKRRQEARGMHNSKTRAAAAASAAAAEADGGKKGKDKGSKEHPMAMKLMSKAVSKKIVGSKEKKDPIAEAAAAADHPEPKLPPSPHLPKPKGILKSPSRRAPAPVPGAESDDDDVSVSSVATDSSLTNSQKKRRQQSKRTIRFAREYACKTVSTARVKTGQLAELLNEIYVMRTLDHPYILRLYEVYQVKRKIWLITEYCSGGDLTSRKMDEPRVAVVLEQILRAVAYMHRRGIMQYV